MHKAHSDHVILGRLGSVYGVRGWLKLHTFTHPPEQIFEYDQWLIQHQRQWITLTLEAHRAHAGGYIVKFAEINSPEDARAYTNDDIAVQRADLPNTESDEFYCHDLIGLSVTNTNGEKLGKIIDIHETGSNDVFIIKGKSRHLIPYLDHVVISIDLEKGEMIVDWTDDF